MVQRIVSTIPITCLSPADSAKVCLFPLHKKISYMQTPPDRVGLNFLFYLFELEYNGFLLFIDNFAMVRYTPPWSAVNLADFCGELQWFKSLSAKVHGIPIAESPIAENPIAD